MFPSTFPLGCVVTGAIKFQFSFSFTIETWLKLDSGYTTGPYPILCTTNGTFCLWTEGGVLYGRYGNYMVNSTTTLTGGTWYSIVYRHSVESMSLV